MITSAKVMSADATTFGLAPAYEGIDYIWAAKEYPVESAVVNMLYDNMIKSGKKPVGDNWKRIDRRQAWIRICQQTAARRAEQHPRFTIDAAIQTGDVRLSMDAMERTEEGKKIITPIQEGFVVSKNEQIAPAMISEAVAYSITTASGSVGDNIIGMAQLNMLDDDYQIASPPQSVDKSAPANAAYCYAMYEKQPRTMLQHAVEITAKWTHTGTLRVAATANPFPNIPAVSWKQGALTVPIPTGAAQPSTGYTDERSFYAYLARHRAIRGEDKNIISELTSGYYVCAMSRALDRTLWRALDILHFMETRSRKKLYYSTMHLTSYEQRILAANGVQLHPVTSDLILPQAVGKVYHKDYSLVDVDSVVYVKDYFGTTSPGNEKKDVSKDPIIALIVAKIKAMPAQVLTHTFLRDMHKDYAVNLVQSIHCHAGHIMFTNILPSKNEPAVVVPVEFQRMTVANKYKTAFGYRHRPFCTVDPFINHPLAAGFILPCVRGDVDNPQTTTAKEMTAWLSKAAPTKSVLAFRPAYNPQLTRQLMVCSLCQGDHLSISCPTSPQNIQTVQTVVSSDIVETTDVGFGPMIPMSGIGDLPDGFSRFASLTTLDEPDLPPPSAPPNVTNHQGNEGRGRGGRCGGGGRTGSRYQPVNNNGNSNNNNSNGNNNNNNHPHNRGGERPQKGGRRGK